jgi:hypothetical protein
MNLGKNLSLTDPLKCEIWLTRTILQFQLKMFRTESEIQYWIQTSLTSTWEKEIRLYSCLAIRRLLIFDGILFSI